MGATNCPETPRQKMIGMMYLMLTCMLALNVSKDILDAFVIVNEGLEKTNVSFTISNGFTYDAFDQAKQRDPRKVEAYYNAAKKIKDLTTELFAYIKDAKVRLIMEADGKPRAECEKAEENMKLLEAKDNRDAPHRFMLGESVDGSQGEARKIKEKLIEFKKKVFALLNDPKIILPDKEAQIKKLKDLGINTDDNKEFNPDKPEEKFWETSLFAEIPCAATITIMTQLQNQVKNAESKLISTLFSGVGSTDIKTDTVAPRSIPKSNYLISGESYEADIFIAAFSSTDTSSVVEIGDSYDSINGKLNNVTQKIKVSRGVGKYKIDAGVGNHKYAAVINVYNSSTGIFKPYPVKQNGKYEIEYTVAPPMAVVSPTKMNVLYIGVDNPMEISVPGFRDDQVSASCSGGSLFKSGKGWVAKVTKVGKCSISVSAKDDKGGSKSMGSKEFRVKRVPDPVPTVAGKKGGGISKGLLAAQAGVAATLENFDFDLKFNVTGFTVSANIGGFTQDEVSASSRFTPAQLNLLNKVQKGKKVYIENVRCVGPDGTSRNIGSIALKIE